MVLLVLVYPPHRSVTCDRRGFGTAAAPVARDAQPPPCPDPVAPLPSGSPPLGYFTCLATLSCCTIYVELLTFSWPSFIQGRVPIMVGPDTWPDIETRMQRMASGLQSLAELAAAPTLVTEGVDP